MTTDLGRPRDPRIDDAVLRATVELLGKSGYADLSVDAIARRAGTSKPAIYRRWPSKAHLVHEAVVPDQRGDRAARHRLAGRRRPRNGASLGGRADHAGRAGGIARAVAEIATDPTLHAKLLERFGDILARGLTDRLDDAMARGEVRPDVNAADLVEAIAGMTLMALLTRNQRTNDAWVERTATLITKGINA